MAKTRTTATSATRTAPARQPITLELAAALCPHATLAENLARTFGLDPVDAAAIREATEEHLAMASRELPLSERALLMHLQRIVGAYVGSAFGAGQFFSTKVTQARDLTARSANDSRDEDRDGPAGFDSRAERARIFAAEMGLQAHALLAAAEGAVSAFAHLTGEDWKPYEAAAPMASTVSRASADTQLAALG